MKHSLHTEPFLVSTFHDQANFSYSLHGRIQVRVQAILRDRSLFIPGKKRAGSEDFGWDTKKKKPS